MACGRCEFSRGLAIRALMAVMTLFALFQGTAHAQSYPTKPTRVIVGGPAGGLIDLTARVYAENFGAQLKQSFFVENRPGANELVGLGAVAQAEPGGYTLFMGSNGLTALPVLLKSAANRDVLKEITPVGNVLTFNTVFLARPDVPYSTIDELITYMKRNPGKAVYAGGGGFTALQSAWFRAITKVNALYVAYGAGPQAYQAIAGGQADFMLQILGPAISASAAGKAKLLAITGNKRNEALPAVPSLKESQDPEVRKLADTTFGTTWIGLFAPVGTSSAVIAVLAKAKAESIRDPQLVARLKSFYGELPSDTPESFTQAFIAEAATYKTVAAQVGIQPE